MSTNDYLEQVLEQQVHVENELNRRGSPKKKAPARAMKQQMAMDPAPVYQQSSGEDTGVMQRMMAPTPTPSPSMAFEDDDVDDSSISFGSSGNGPSAGHRVTGWWRFKTVVVPPNVYVVHTRRGAKDPVHIGLGISFRYNPNTDAFLLIPAAMQTIVINARCICLERQGILVQAYVQWIIDDIKTAYQRLDFADALDPMRVVNVQLREQAEAAIKDKVATMSIDAVLADKQPIIEELTHRLRQVGEGSREAKGIGEGGLGLKIVTVQIKEAVVSSRRLWENLQAPFRAEREKEARLAQLQAQQQIASRELEARSVRESAELDTEHEIEQRRAAKDHESYDRQRDEDARRHRLDQEAEQARIREGIETTMARQRAEAEEEQARIKQENETSLARKRAELELALEHLELDKRRVAQEVEALQRRMELERAQADRDKAFATAQVEIAELNSSAQTKRRERELALERTKREIENVFSDAAVRARLIDKLPEIAKTLPKPEHMRVLSVGGGANGATPGAHCGNPLTGMLTSLLSSLDEFIERRAQPPIAAEKATDAS